jgi:glycosyltransferase 2 family protein
MKASHRSPRRTLFFVAKATLATAILAYLIYKAQQDARFEQLWEQPKDWRLLSAALACAFGSIVLSFLRWRILVLALGINFRISDALRLGSLGYALNFVSLGNLGGDLFKAVFLAHRQPGRRTEAIATVIVDRLMGLAVMLVLASVGIMATGLVNAEQDALRTLCRAILLATAGGLTGVAVVLFVPALTGPSITTRIHSIPLLGAAISRLIQAVRAYRDQKNLLAQACALSFVVDMLYIVSFYLVAQGLPSRAPTLGQHLVIVPVANLAGAIPVTPAGLGTLELATETLYRSMPSVGEGVGTIATLAHRLTTIAVAIMGVIYYFGYRAEVHDVLVEAEELADDI